MVVDSFLDALIIHLSIFARCDSALICRGPCVRPACLDSAGKASVPVNTHSFAIAAQRAVDLLVNTVQPRRWAFAQLDEDADGRLHSYHAGCAEENGRDRVQRPAVASRDSGAQRNEGLWH
jgi:hypothetical protein